MDRLHQLAFRSFNSAPVRPQRWRVPKLMTDWHASGKSAQTEFFPALLVEVGAGVEQPLEVAEDAPAVALHGNDALVAAFLRDLRLIIGQAIQQAGLKFSRASVQPWDSQIHCGQ